METRNTAQNNTSSFYKQFSSIRERVVESIENKLELNERRMVSQRFFNRIFILYFLCSKQVFKLKKGQPVKAKELFDLLLLEGKLVANIYHIFTLLQTKGNKRFFSINEYTIIIPFLHEEFYPQTITEQQIEINMNHSDWEEIFTFLNDFDWQVEKVINQQALTPEILGYIYERSSVEWEENNASSSNKFSSRKDKGVFYTREEITQYILRYTLYPAFLERLENRYSDLLDFLENGNDDCKTAIEIVDSLTFLDPACGSGAFILAAANEVYRLKCILLKKIEQSFVKGEMKKQIVKNNLYGVDLLESALEITKIRLWLWSIDAENNTNKELELPEIAHFQKGNSLIGNISEGDFSSGSTEEIEELEPFHWANIFANEMTKGGFDIIIGNPPYGAKITEVEQKIIAKTYQCTASKNTAEYFMERSFQLLKPNGLLGFVVPKQIAFTHKWRKIRENLLQKSKIKNLFDVGLAFEGVDYEALVIISKKIIKGKSLENVSVRIDIAANLRNVAGSKEPRLLGYNKQGLMQYHNILIFKHLTSKDEEILQLIKDNSKPFGSYFKVNSFRGIYFNQEEEKQLQNGGLVYIRGGPSIQRHFLKNIKLIRLPEARKREGEKLLKPKIIFKALRGTQLVAFVDVYGNVISDSNMNNIILKDEHSNLLKSFQLILNHKLVSYYLSKLVFSETTETARHLDNPYVIPIPIPTGIDCAVCNEMVDALFFINQYYYTHFLSNKKSQAEIKSMIDHFERVANALSYELFFSELLKTKLQETLETKIFINNEKWDSIEKIKDLYKKLLSSIDIESTITTIHSHEYVKRIEEKQNPF